MEIGDKKVIHSASLIVPEGDSALVEFSIELWKARVRIAFKNDLEGDSKSTIDVKGENDVSGESSITFLNWKNPIGTATTIPVRIGRTNTNQEIFIMAAHWYIGSVNKLDIHFLLGAG